jgi:hypothetical protein
MGRLLEDLLRRYVDLTPSLRSQGVNSCAVNALSEPRPPNRRRTHRTRLAVGVET